MKMKKKKRRRDTERKQKGDIKKGDKEEDRGKEWVRGEEWWIEREVKWSSKMETARR